MRSFSKILRGPATATTPQNPGEGAPRSRDWIERSVETGYRLVDEYIRAGRSAAERAGVQGRETLLTPGQPTARMWDYTNDFVRAGLEFFQAFADRAGVQPPSGSAQPFAANSAGSKRVASTESARPLQLLLDAGQRVQASLALKPGSFSGRLIAQAPRRVDQRRSHGPAVGISVAIDPRSQTLRVRVAEGAKAGRYACVLVDAAQNLPRGRLTLRVWAASGT